MQGVDTDYDSAEAAVNAREDDLKDHLKDVRRSLGGGREVCFVSVNKESHLIEVPHARLIPLWRSPTAAAALAHARWDGGRCARPSTASPNIL